MILQDCQLPAGRYFFEEVQTQPNYLISSAARAIQLDVPVVADNTPLSPMRLNGEPLWQTAAGQLPNTVMTTAQPRVINAQKQATTQLPANRTSQGDDVLDWPNYFGHEFFFIVSWVIHEERIKS